MTIRVLGTGILILAVLVLIFVPGSGAGGSQSMPVPNETCLQCHTDAVKDNAHYLMLSGESTPSVSCESCHGPGMEHIMSGGQASMVVTPRRDEIKQHCLSCHPQDRTLSSEWQNSSHVKHPEMDCLSCHNYHKYDHPSQLKQEQTELCSTCHFDIAMEIKRPFHHPIESGQMQCSDCHNPHKPDPRPDRASKVNESCYSCHAEIKGPFMWRHKAVTDDLGCLNCHQPHGSTGRKLLRHEGNQLCLGCHQGELMLSGYISNSDRRTRATLEHSRIPALQGRCNSCHGEPFRPIVSVHYNSVPRTDCNYCHADIGAVDHTRFLTEGQCIDCHADVHGSNHSRTFQD